MGITPVLMDVVTENRITKKLCRVSSYLVLKLLGAVLKRGRRLFQRKGDYPYEILKLYNFHFPINNK